MKTFNATFLFLRQKKNQLLCLFQELFQNSQQIESLVYLEWGCKLSGCGYCCTAAVKRQNDSRRFSVPRILTTSTRPTYQRQGFVTMGLRSTVSLMHNLHVSKIIWEVVPKYLVSIAETTFPFFLLSESEQRLPFNNNLRRIPLLQRALYGF